MRLVWVLLPIGLLLGLGLAPSLPWLSGDDAGHDAGAAVDAPAGASLPAWAEEPAAAARAPSAATVEDLQATIATERQTAIVRAARRVAPAVVSVNVLRRETVQPRSLWESLFIGPGSAREVPGLGSGFIIDATGLVLTNEHVVRGATEIVVTLSDGRDLEARVVGTDEFTDLALLRLSGDGQPLPAAPLGTARDLVIGEWVVAIGNPFGFLLSNTEPTVTAGVVSGVGRNIVQGGTDSRGIYLDMIQTDASINPGNSGGPLVNALGEVIGVNSSIISGSGGSVGLGFAIPIDRARRIARDLLENGEVRRVWLGATVGGTPTGTGRLGRSRGVQIAAVAPGSPAARAGLRAGMAVSAVAGQPVHAPLDWEARLLDARVGDAIEIDVVDGGAERRVRVVAEGLPSLAAERVSALDDVQLVTVTPAIRAERGLVSESGALIVRASPALREVGLREGDLILQINRTALRSAEEAASLLRRLGAGAPIRILFERQGQYGSVSFYITG
jgi:serine protease Do